MTRRLFTVALLIKAFITICVAANQQGALYCLRSGTTWTMRLIVLSKGDTITSLTAINLAPEPMIAECSTDTSDGSAFVRGTGLDDDPFIIEIVWEDGVLRSETDCGAEKLGSTGRFAWLFEARRVPILPQYESLIFSGDVQYYVECDFPSQSDVIKVVNKGVTVQGETLRRLEATEEVVTLTIQGQNQQPAAIVNLGTEISLALELTPIPNGATGVYAYECRSCDKEDCSNYVYAILDDRGCVADNNHIVPVGSSGFIGTPLRSQTAYFSSFRFVSEKMVWFECKVDFCYNGQNIPCEDYCLYRKLSGQRRRRRDATEEREVTSLLLVADNEVTQTEALDLDHDSAEPCRENFAYMIAVIVLAVVLLAFVLVCAVLFVRLRRSK